MADDDSTSTRPTPNELHGPCGAVVLLRRCRSPTALRTRALVHHHLPSTRRRRTPAAHKTAVGWGAGDQGCDIVRKVLPTASRSC
eukprot:5495486-Prymnesium_polylepis.1